MPTPWNDDAPGSAAVIEDNLRRLLKDLHAGAVTRSVPTAAMVQEWHRRTHRGVQLPVSYYAGEFRDSDPRFPELIGYEVRVGAYLGVPSAKVPSAVAAFESGFARACRHVDRVVPDGRRLSSVEALGVVLELAARAHGEWVRIHPFANGNGRTARLLANWVALRYSLPPFVRLEPRPAASAYAAAADRSMTGDHDDMVAVFNEMLRVRLSGGSSAV